MVVNNLIIEDLSKDAGNARYEKAKNYQKSNKVRIKKVEYIDNKNFEVSAIVIGTSPYRTYVEVKDGYVEDISCTCEDYYKHYGVCKHTLATVLELNNNPQYKEEFGDNEEENELKSEKVKYRNFKQIVNTFYNEELEGLSEVEEEKLKNKGTIKIEPEIYYDKFSGDMRVEFKIGNKRMYKIKNLAEFYTRMIDKEFYKYGEKLQFVHTPDVFDQDSQGLLQFILKYAEIIKYANSNSNSNYRYYGKALSETSIILGNSGIDDLFEILKGKNVSIQKDYHKEIIEFTEEQPKIEFILRKRPNETFVIFPNTEIYEITIIKGKEYKYILDDKKLYRITKEFENSSLRLLELFKQNYLTEVECSVKEIPEFFSIIMPKVKNGIKLENISEEEIEKYKPKPLEVKVYLDFDKNNYLIADVEFIYGENKINPLDEKQKTDFPRNMIKETKSLNLFRQSGFMLDVKNLRFILPNDDKIYEFLTEDINIYMQKFDVMVTDNFKTKQIRMPKMAGLGVKVENDLLSIDLSKIDIDSNELKDILDKYSLKKKYHRLKDGSFINLEDNKEIEFLDKLATGMGVDFKDLEEGEIKLPVSRTLYLDRLLKGIKGTEIIKNDEYKKIVSDLNKEQLEGDIKLPEKLDKTLRYYQKTGFKWLKTLDYYHFGGILADDMGLRKDNSNIISCFRLCRKCKRKQESEFSSVTKLTYIKLAK